LSNGYFAGDSKSLLAYERNHKVGYKKTPATTRVTRVFKLLSIGRFKELK